MSELLKEEEVEVEVLNEYNEVVYSGEFDEYLAINNYDVELEDVLNCVQSGSIRQWENEDGEMLTIREVA